ncbi:MAG: amidophosphoribosyltransferase [Bacteroidia bacterium]
MSDSIKHECGIALVRLLKPLQYYVEKYRTGLYGINKLYLLMEKQHNRGQDGAGVAGVKMDMPPGKPYIFRYRSTKANPIQDIFSRINKSFQFAMDNETCDLNDVECLKNNVTPYGEVLMGHLRYGTYSSNLLGQCHPFIRENNWMTRNLVLAGNFNMTNNDQLFGKLVELGQHPTSTSDTVTVLEKVGHFLDEENERLYREYKALNYERAEITTLISDNLDIARVLQRSTRDFDGGYAIEGLVGNGDAFVMRDPIGIRPAFFYYDDEILVAASERPPIKTALSVDYDQIQELKPGHALIVKKDGRISQEQILEPQKKRSCSFERIYFSRGTDKDIYLERKQLGRLITPALLEAVGYDMVNTVFSYIPNTAETAFLGMTEAIDVYLDNHKRDEILRRPGLSAEELSGILSMKHRFEKIAVKDMKMRTFITNDTQREDMVAHIYDTTYGVIREGKDSLVILDDSIVRGTTLKESIIRILDRLGPKRIIVASSAPQIRYPDCYGIDMSKLKDFVAFRAAIALIQDSNMEDLMESVYWKCKEQDHLEPELIPNYVKELYAPFSTGQITDKISELLKPKDCNAEVKILFQSIENLHEAIPGHKGDWYFTGNYPTPGGNKVVNRAYQNYYEGKNIRAY